MKITIDRNLCEHALPDCERYFARFVQNPNGMERLCIAEYEDDHDPTLHLVMRYDGHEETLVIPPEDRTLIASAGWSLFVKVKPKFYREAK